MKRLFVLLALVFVVVLSGCSVINGNDHKSVAGTLKTLDLMYSPGSYTLGDASCTGYITSGQTDACLFVPLGKKLDRSFQEINLTSVTNVMLRHSSGGYLLGNTVDLSDYIDMCNVINDGSVLFIRLRNPEQWKDDSGKVLANNTLLVGHATVTFSVSE